MLTFSSILVCFLLSLAGSEGKLQRKGRGYVEGGEVKPGHYEIKEYHFHFYFRQNYEAEVNAAWEIRNKIVAEVAAGNMTVVCDGVTSDIIPGLDDSKVPGFWTEPIGPHAVGQFNAWVPREYLAEMLSFAMLHRGDLTVLLHPLAHDEVEDHTRDAMWLGEMSRMDLHILSNVGGDDPEFPELGLGYNSKLR